MLIFLLLKYLCDFKNSAVSWFLNFILPYTHNKVNMMMKIIYTLAMTLSENKKFKNIIMNISTRIPMKSIKSKIQIK